MPTGLWFEDERSRWRVRLYKAKKVFWLSYHDDETEARDTLTRALALRAKYKKLNTKEPVSEPSTQNLIRNLRTTENHQLQFKHYLIRDDDILLFNFTPCDICSSPTTGNDTLSLSMDDLDKVQGMDIRSASDEEVVPAINQGGQTLCTYCRNTDDPT